MTFISHRERQMGKRGAVTDVIPCIVSHGEWNYQQDLETPPSPLHLSPSLVRDCNCTGYGTKLNKPSNAATR